MPRNSCVEFKGSKEGIIIYFDENVDFDYLKKQLICKIEAGKHFFNGARVVDFVGRILTEDEKNEIKEIIHNSYGMVILEKKEENPIKDTKKEVFEGIEEGNTKFLRTTVRSGQKINYPGNVVIIGDINPGAEVVAEGNILVMGSMRGFAHAGSSGNQKAFVAAYCLQPTQLRIAEVIARSPDHDTIKPNVPEMAMIKNHAVVIEPYLPNK